jgi:hypothetical protein
MGAERFQQMRFTKHQFEAPSGFSLCTWCGNIDSPSIHYRATPGWRPIETAPRNATWIRVMLKSGKEIDAHWAQDLSGECQPPFAGWFNRNRAEITEQIIGWRDLTEAL